MFCPKCQSILVPFKEKKKSYWVCKSCGYHTDLKIDEKRIEKIIPEKEIEVLEDVNILATHDHICSKCGYGKAELVQQEAWYADEDGLIQFKCGKCGHKDKAEGIRTQ
jgi:DNA-directed RNA polymerase subunit M